MKVLVAFKNPAVDSPAACHQGLGITALNIAMALEEQRTDASAFPVANGEGLWAKLGTEWADFTHVILCAPFIDAPFLGKLFRQFADKKFSLVYHSNLGFLSQDRFAGLSIPAYMDLAKSYRNFTVAANSQRLADAIAHATGQPFGYLPNLYHLPNQTRRTRPAWSKPQTLRVGLFGASRVLKNWLTAGAAAMIMARNLGTPVELHVSSGRDEGAAATRENLKALLQLNPLVTLVEAPWLAHDDFLRYLQKIDLLMQPSFTETFNNVTADGCACGVPSVVSEAIDWVPKSWIAMGDSATSVASTACALVRDRKAGMAGWKALDAYNKDALAAWNRWLNT